MNSSTQFKEQIFLFTNDDIITVPYFQGYCFVGKDIIINSEGFKKYLNEKNKTIEPGEDGCYVSVYRDNDSIIIGADANGYKKIFYYNENNKWIVSNSLEKMIEKLKQWKAKLTKNKAQYLITLGGTNLTQQMSSYHTIFEEIKLLPSYNYIKVLKNKFSFEQWLMPKFSTYEEALTAYINLWNARIKTLLLSDENYVVPDLTGGRDSRAVCALFYHATSQLDSGNIQSNFTFNSSKYVEKDFESANLICKKYNLPLNKSLPPYKSQKLSSYQQYKLWKEINFGTYHSFFTPNAFPSQKFFKLSGAAGGNHSPFYPQIETSKFLDRYKKYFTDTNILNHDYCNDEIFEKWKFEVQDSLNQLVQHTSAGNVHPHILMYREFRDRFHGGRSPQYGLTLVPLASKYLTAASNLCSAEKLENFQIHVDIMENLCPDLVNMPYESEAKEPSKAALDRICCLTGLEVNSDCGDVYTSKIEYEIDGYNGKITPFSLFHDEFEAYAETYNDGLLSKNYVKGKSSEMSEIAKQGKFNHAAHIFSYNHILMHKFFD